MRYGLAKLRIGSLVGPAFAVGIALTRLDERIASSSVGAGFLERTHFSDACASLWIDGVHLEDLILHDATSDIRAPTHELTIARGVLRTRRRMAAQPPGWALSADGLRSLRGLGAESGYVDGATDEDAARAAAPGATVFETIGEGEGTPQDPPP